MPDDPLFPTPDPTVPTPPAPNGSDPPATSPAGGDHPLSLDDIQGAIQSAVAPLQQQVAGLTEENRQLREGLTPQPPTDPTPGGAGDDFYTELARDPQAAIGQIVQDNLKSLAPLIGNLHATAQSAHLQGHANEIDTQFGSGTWQEEFAPVIEARFTDLQKTDPAGVINPETISREVSALKGAKFDTLMERRDKATQDRTTAEKERLDEMAAHVINSTGMTGGVRASNANRPLTEAEKDYVRLRREHSGVEVDPQALRRNTSLTGHGTGGGTSLSDWQAAQQADKKDS